MDEECELKSHSDRSLISGFTIVRNAEKFDYPFEESLTSLLPLVSEMVVNVGLGEDQTLQRIYQLAKQWPEVKWNIFESEWPLNDPEKKKGGQILSEQTNLALEKCTQAICFYLQADEVLHEEDYDRFQDAALALHRSQVADGVVFNYRHFYGNFDTIQSTRSAYRREVRMIRNRAAIQSVGDAQSFRYTSGKKVKCYLSEARIFHYGWTRSPEKMREKTFFLDQLYHGNPTAEQEKNRVPHTGENYKYKRIWGLKPFQETHPNCMKARIQQKNWVWDLKNSPYQLRKKDLKNIVLDQFEKITKKRAFEYRCYKLVGKC